jgi:twitching motility two-component system response regulator PilG
MKTILLVHEQKEFHRIVLDGLKAYGSVTAKSTEDFLVKSASNAKEALNVLNRFKVDLIVMDIDGPTIGGFELLTAIKKSDHRDIPVIVVTASDSPEIKNWLKQAGVLHHLKKPFILLELLERVQHALDERSKGLISDFTLTNFLQAVQMEEKTCTLEITSKGKSGYLHLKNGQLIDAEANGLTGDSAAIEILGWESTAQIKIEELNSNRRTIHAPLMQMLLEAAKVADERDDVTSRHDSLFNEAVTLAEGHYYNKAHEKLAAFLKAYPKSHKGWLWYSRVNSNMKSIETALDNARKIAPNDSEVVEEIHKVELAKRTLRSEQIRRCPFCWAPANVKAFECPYCRAHLFVHEELLLCTKAANRGILQEAIDRYTKVATRETNPAAYYYLSIAHFNLGKWEKGLDQLNNTVKVFPEKKSYAEQLHMLINLLLSSEHMFAQETVVKGKVPGSAPATAVKADKKKILLAESSPPIRKAISIAFARRGYDVIEAGDGLEALNHLDKVKPDLILMDIILPKLDSYNVLSFIRENSDLTGIPVIILTGKEGGASNVEGKFAGSVAYLSKPFDLSKLLETTENYLKQD